MRLTCVPNIWVAGVVAQTLEAGQLVLGNAVLEDHQGGECLHLKFLDEEGALLGINFYEFALNVHGGNHFQVVIHNFTPLEVLVVEMDRDPSASGDLE